MMRIALGLTLCALLLPGAALAGSCGFERCYGAVGLGTSGAWGVSFGQYSAQAARKLVQAKCKDKCEMIQTFYNSCAALAVADNGGWGWSTGATLEQAEKLAMEYCVPNGTNCHPLTSICSR
jgi:hypothetical protein